MEFEFIYSPEGTSTNYFICWDVRQPQLVYTGTFYIVRDDKNLSFRQFLKEPHLTLTQNDVLILTVKYTFTEYYNAKEYIKYLQNNGLAPKQKPTDMFKLNQLEKKIEKTLEQDYGYLPDESNFDILFNFHGSHYDLVFPLPRQQRPQTLKTSIKLGFHNKLNDSIKKIPNEWKDELSKVNQRTTNIHDIVTRLFYKKFKKDVLYTDQHINMIFISITQ